MYKTLIKKVKAEVKEIKCNPYRAEIIRNTVIKQILSYSPNYNCKLIVK